MPFASRVLPEPHGTIANPAETTGQPYPLGVLKSIIRLAARSCGTEFSALYFTDRRLRWLSISLGLDGLCPPKDIEASLRGLTSGGEVQLGDVRADHQAAGIPLARVKSGVRSCAGVALPAERGPLGTLFVLGRRPDAVGREGMEILRELAAIAGNVVETWLAGGANALDLSTDGRRHLRLLDTSTDLVYSQKLSGALSAVNEAWESVLGFRRHELIGRNIAELVTPRHRESVCQMVLELAGGSEPRATEIDFLTKDGRRITLELRSQLLFDHGRPIGSLGLARRAAARESGARETQRGGGPLRELHRLCTVEYRDDGEFHEDLIRTCCRLLGLKVGMVGELQDQHCLIRAASADPDSPHKGQRIPIQGTRFAAVVSKKRTCRYSVRQPRRQRAIYEPRAAGLLLCVPVLLGARLWGIVAFASREHETGMDEESVRMVELAAKSLGHRLMAQAVVGASGRSGRGHKAGRDRRRDRLTGLANSHAIRQRLESSIEAARRRNGKLAAILVDLDWFKHYNDTLGHVVADRLLRRVGERLQGCLRRGDALGRVEADRFLFVTRKMEDEAEANRVARKIQAAIRVPFKLEGLDLHVTASLGVSLYPRDAEDAASLVWNAEAALDEVKKSSRDDLAFYAPRRRTKGTAVRTMENALRGALERDEFHLRYQPQFRMDGTVAGMEALLAWHHRRLGDVPAEQFIPLAEDTGLIVPIGAWVLQRACRQNAAWRRRQLEIVKLSVNVSALQLAQVGFIDVVARALEEAALPASALELEVTESVLMRDIDQSVKVLAGLRKLGVGVSIDDFGTGYSSLSYLRRLPANTLKIDRSFLEDAASAKSTLALIETIVSLAHGLDMSVVGEGVESVGQLELLQRAGCDRVQGHLFGQPLTVAKAGALIQLAAGNTPAPVFPPGSRQLASAVAAAYSV